MWHNIDHKKNTCLWWRAKTRRQSIIFWPRWECACWVTQIFCLSALVCKSAINSDLGATNKLQWLAEFPNMETINSEDGLCIFWPHYSLSILVTTLPLKGHWCWETFIWFLYFSFYFAQNTFHITTRVTFLK